MFLSRINCRRVFVSLALTTHTTAAFVVAPPFSTTTSRLFASASTTNLAMTKKVLVPIGEGSEEIETTCITDTLTRFGAAVTVASVMDGELVCKMSRGIKVMADMSIEDAAKEEWDLVALPGGMPGAQHLCDSKALTSILQKQKSSQKLYAAVCASPAVALAPQGLIDNAALATCYPAPNFREKLNTVSDDAVVVTGNLITSQGPGTSLAFALTLGEQLYGKEKRDEIAKQMLVS